MLHQINKKYTVWIWLLSIIIPLAVVILFNVKIEGVERLWFLPPIYAAINATTAIILVVSVNQIRKGNRKAHERLMKTAIDNSDAIIIAGDDIPAELSKYLKKLEKPVLDYKTPEEFSAAYQDFYDTQVLSQ